MLYDISVLPLASFQDIVGQHCNPFLTVLVSGNPASGKLSFVTTAFTDGNPHERTLSAIEYLKYLRSALPPGTALADDVRLVFQAEDVPIDIPSASWEARNDWNNVALVPDLYYFNAKGYEDTPLVEIPWSARTPAVVWRGSTTGLYHQRADHLDALPRYRLCRIASELGAAVDVGLNAAVQAADAQQEELIRDRLMAEGLFKPFLPMAEMARYRYIFDIDGNSNSWNFMLKLRLGCCVLKVESHWQQWFAQRIEPWVHYVPIAQDLSDLHTQIAWCLDNDAECAAIAQRGVRFAEAMTFADEMATAATRIFQTAETD